MGSKRQKFALLRAARRVWAISSIHGDAERLMRLHQQLGNALEPGDRVVYLGNMIGRGPLVRETVDEILLFRREFLSMRNAFQCDIAYLRGSQEEMWQKLLQLQFASDPRGVLKWMLGQGLDSTLSSYGFDPEASQHEAGTGPMQLTRWTGRLRQAVQAQPGHYELFGTLRRAAYTEDAATEDPATEDPNAEDPDTEDPNAKDRGLLFVNAGLDPSRPLETQKDSFWWVSNSFGGIAAPYDGFRRVVRGFAPNHPGLELTDYTATLDGGCGFGGPLMAACFLPHGEAVEQIEI